MLASRHLPTRPTSTVRMAVVLLSAWALTAGTL